MITVREKLDLAQKDDVAGTWGKLCIYKVPQYLRDGDDKSFIPNIVSLGPYHHGKRRLRNMDRHKWRAFYQILKRGNQDAKLYINSIKELEEKARACYEGQITISSNEFVEMMVLDGCFALELFRGAAEGFMNLGYSRCDPVFTTQGSMHSIQRDMGCFCSWEGFDDWWLSGIGEAQCRNSAQLYAILKPLYDEWMDVKVNSPQMSRETTYKMSLKDFTLQCSSESRNPFVEYAVQYSIAAAYATLDKSKKNDLQKLLLQGMDITILGCNDFYSYRNQIEARGLPLVPESLASLPPFTSITFNAEESNVVNIKPEVAKTGLGSSAAMTTAVVAALLNYLGVVDLLRSSKNEKSECSADMDTIHMIAQTAHCIAQGKVGSGFDVSSAVYGSHRYVRFSPNIISSAQEAVSITPLDEVIGEVLKGKWDHERTKFSLPPLMNLVLGEPGSGGSSTPSMVGAVKRWQKSDPQKSTETWNKLSEANSELEKQLNLLSKLAAENWDAYKTVIEKCSMLKSEKWEGQVSEASEVEIVKALLGARDAMLKIRSHMRQMGEAAGIPIEPESQTRLLDVSMETEGVLLGGVPGAGGFDAVFAITLGDSSMNLTKVWSSHNVLALLVREDPRGVSLESDDPRV